METRIEIKHDNKFPLNLNIDRIGNLIAILASRINDLHSTKLLKLLYLIDETSVKEIGVSVTDLKYKVWRKGPVPSPVYYDLIDSNPLSTKFVDVKTSRTKDLKNQIDIVPKNSFKIDYDEFSEYELELVDRIIKEYGDWASDKLVNFLHSEGSAWKMVVDQYNLEDYFSEESPTTHYEINFKEIIKNNPYLLAVYKNSEDSKYF